VTVPPDACQENTLFKQLDCLLDELLSDVEGTDLSDRAVLRSRLLNAINTTKEKKAEAEDLCGLGDEAQATTAMTVALESMNTFIARVNESDFLDTIGVKSQFLSKATPIRDIVQSLVDTGVCSGGDCLPDPPRSAIQCEVDQLLEDVAQQATDAQIAEKLAKKLNKISQILENLNANCEVDNLNKATGNVKKIRTAVKNILGQVNKLETRGQIPDSLIADLRNGGARITAILDNLSTNGVCQ
jgi:hypothetical protein